MEVSRVVEESGPDEDHHTVRKLKPPKVFEEEPTQPVEIAWNSGVFEVSANDPVINRFLDDVPWLKRQEKPHGLIWNKNLQPAECKYELGEHYLSTREGDRKSMQGTVSFYRDGVTGVKFAIKTLQKDALFRAEEVKLALTKEHPNICSVYGIIIRDGCVNILLEHAGAPLTDERAWIAESPDRMLSLARQTFQALEAVHEHGYVHCDIKPDNIMIVKDGSEFTVKLIDFGTSHQTGSVLPYDAHTTLFYWSPEIWQALDCKNPIICRPGMDVYAVALTLYFVQTSAHLMQRLGNQDMKNVMTKTPDDLLFIALPEEIPSDLRAVMKQCLSGRPDNRLSAEQAVKQLTEDVTMQPAPSTPDEVNYKDSFKKICASFHNDISARPTVMDTRTALKVPSVEFSKFIPEFAPIQYYVGSSKGIEKRELRPVTKGRKGACSTGSKLSKARSKGKNSVKITNKSCPPGMQKSFSQTTVAPALDCTPNSNSEKNDDRAYPCSSVLKNLALRVQPCPAQAQQMAQVPEMTQSSQVAKALQRTVSGKEKNGSEKAVTSTADPVTKEIKKTVKPSCEIPEAETVRDVSNKQVDWTQKFIGDNPESGTREKDKGERSSENMTSETITKYKQQYSKENTDIFIHPSVKSQTLDTPPRSRQENEMQIASMTNEVSRSTEDDMEFVISAFDENIFTGRDDDIIDNWINQLDNDVESENCGPANESSMEINARQASVQTAPDGRRSEEEPMDTGHDQANIQSMTCTGVSSRAEHRESRKRMAESTPNPSGIPGKAACLSPSQHLTSKHQLPDFEQILPENI